MTKSTNTTAATTTAADLKRRLNSSLRRLSDRDTFALAAAELSSLAVSVPSSSLSTFLSTLLSSPTPSSLKSSARAHTIRVISVIASHHPASSLSPHLHFIISSIIRKLRDSDSAVRAACVNVVSDLSRVVSPVVSFSTILDPFLSAIVTEQETNAQIGAAMCLSAAIEAAAVVADNRIDVVEVRKGVGRLVRLVKGEGYKAKAAVMGVIGSMVEANGGEALKGGGGGVVGSVVGSAVEMLRSEDWAARKAAAEVLEKVARVGGKENGVAVEEVRETCVKALESRRFDKVKVTRETMNRALAAWKKVGSVDEDESRLSRSNSSASKDTTSGCSSPPISKSSQRVGVETPESSKHVTPSRSSTSGSDESTTTFSPPISNSRSPIGIETAGPKKTLSRSKSALSTTSAVSTVVQTRTPFQSNTKGLRTPVSRNLSEDAFNWRVEIAVPRTSSSKDDIESQDLNVSTGKFESNECSVVEQSSSSLFKRSDERMQRFTRFRSASCFPFGDGNLFEEVSGDSEACEEVYDNCAEFEGMSLIREQLVQIEKQQSNLLDLLQSFMGTSHSGISSLESRVSGLEHTLGEISYDLASQTGSMPNNEYAGNIWCSLPGTEFLSPKFWRKTEGRYSGTPNHFLNRDAFAKNFETNRNKIQMQSEGTHWLSGMYHDSRSNGELGFRRTPMNFHSSSNI
ncbi:TORTIFOLIA1-like protein [Drosera capensis]